MKAEALAANANLELLGRTGSSVNKTMAALGVTLTAGLAFQKVIMDAARFQGAMTQSLAIMGDVSDYMKNEMAQAARQVGVELNMGAKAAADSYFYLASAGLDAKQSVAALPQVAAFAKAGMFDMAKATDLATDAQSALGLTVKDAQANLVNLTQVTDVLVKANTLANASVEQFATSLTSEAGAALKSYGKDLTEGVAVLAAFADQGVKAEVAGTGLSRILRLMASAANENEEAYKRLGVSVYDASGEMRFLGDIIADLERAFEGMSDKQRVAEMEALGFQARIQGVVMPLLGTSDAIKRYYEELQKAGGITKEVAEKQMQAPLERMGRAIKSIMDQFMGVGETTVGVLVPAVESLAEHMGTLMTVGEAVAVVFGAQWLAGLIASLKAAEIEFMRAAAAETAKAAADKGLALANLEVAKAELIASRAALNHGLVTTDATAASAARAVALHREANALIAYREASAIAATATTTLATRATAGAVVLGRLGTAAKTAFTAIGGWTTVALAGLYALYKAFDWLLDRMVKANELSAEEEARFQKASAAMIARGEAQRQAAEAAAAEAEERERLNEQVSQAERAAQVELARLEALNEAWDANATEIALINLEYDRRAEKISNAEQYDNALLARMNAITDALHDQRVEQEKLAAYRAGQSELAGIMSGISGEAGGRIRDNQEWLRDIRDEIEERKRLIAAYREGKEAVDDLTVSLAAEAAARQFANTPDQILQAVRLARENAQLALELRDVQDAADDAEDALQDMTEPFLQALRNVQDAMGDTFKSLFTDTERGFKDLANSIVDIFTDLAAQIAATLVADKLGIPELLEDLSKGVELSGKWRNIGSAGAGVAFGAGGGPVSGILGGAASGAALGGAVGALIGGASGLVSGLVKMAADAGAASREMRRVQHEWSETLREMTKDLEDAALNDMQRAREDMKDQLRGMIGEWMDLFRSGINQSEMREITPLPYWDQLEDWLAWFERVQAVLPEGTKRAKAFADMSEYAKKAIESLIAEQERYAKETLADFEADLRAREAALRGDEAARLTAEMVRQQERELAAARDLVDSAVIALVPVSV